METIKKNPYSDQGQIFDLKNRLNDNTALLQTIRVELDTKKFQVIMLWILLAISTIVGFAFCFQRNNLRGEAINRGYMIHNPTNGHLQWVEGLTPKQ